MSQLLRPTPSLLISESVKLVHARILVIRAKVNPPEIVTIKGDEFRIDLKRMNQDTPYVLEFQGSRFLIQKNKDGVMTMDDIP